ncbi:DUF2867 domain-containing protein [Salidesulfovibrio brasiliensis]|uniref:DUF2867 domain-containing protein n=1 Tax=Salidesulfovibrio brasiliensis TaxID=221711 RepID=UPI0006D216E3|nr:DUF2867 domain-containing protein [Salidesulfovibrio brasiliensis]
MGRVDAMDIQSTRCDCGLESFVKAFLLDRPAWVRSLMRFRNAVMRFVPGYRHDGADYAQNDVLTVGRKVGPFDVISTDEESNWVAGLRESHLDALVIITRQGEAGTFRFDVATLVKFHNRFGRFYFGLIKPFHVIMVRSLLRKAVKLHAVDIG